MTSKLDILKRAYIEQLKTKHNIPEFIGILMFKDCFKQAQVNMPEVKVPTANNYKSRDNKALLAVNRKLTTIK